MVADLDAVVADQTTVPHAGLFEVADLQIHPRPQPLERRRRIVTKGLLDVLAHEGEVALQNLKAERFLRPEVIGERPLRHPRDLDDVALELFIAGRLDKKLDFRLLYDQISLPTVPHGRHGPDLNSKLGKRISMFQMNDESLDLIFRQARTHSAWRDKPVDDPLLAQVYDLAKMGPTSANIKRPMRIVFESNRRERRRSSSLLWMRATWTRP